MSGVIPSPEFNEQLKRVVRENIRRERGPQPRQGRWHKKGGSGGKKSNCSDYWMVWINASTAVTSGSFDLTITIATAVTTSTAVDVSIDHNQQASGLETKLSEIPELLNEDEELVCRVSDGPIHLQGLVVGNKDQKSYPHIKSLVPKAVHTLSSGRPYVFHLVPQASGE